MLSDGELSLLYLTPEYVNNNKEQLINRLGTNDIRVMTFYIYLIKKTCSVFFDWNEPEVRIKLFNFVLPFH